MDKDLELNESETATATNLGDYPMQIVDEIPSDLILSTLKKPYVLLVKDTKELQYNYYGPQAKVGDIVYKTSTNKFKAIKPSKWDSSLGTAIGVCVIPTSHNVYGTGECAIISLQETDLKWGVKGDLPLKDKAMIGCVGHDDEGEWTPTNVVDHISNVGYICSDNFTDVPNPFDKGTAWFYNDSECHIASPYSADGLRNPAYYQTTTPLTEANATADFNGKSNTSLIYNGLKIYDTDNFAAKWAIFLTTGGLTWYLPACGELGYVMSRLKKINKSLLKVGGGQIQGTYWSSSESGRSLAWQVDTAYGFIFDNPKADSELVRAFACVQLDK